MQKSAHPSFNINLSASLLPSAHSEFVINKKVVDPINRNNFLSDTQYGCCFSRPAADVLCLVIRWRNSKTLYNKFIMCTITFDISKVFTRFGIVGCYTIFPAMESLKKFSQTLSFLSGPWRILSIVSFLKPMRSMQVSHKAHYLVLLSLYFI